MSARPPLVVAEQGFFWAGGERIAKPYGTIAAGAMYVQYQVPAERKFPWALVMVHGGGGQGLDLLGTPDGRPGWAEFFVRRGWATYVVDRPALGRAPYHPDAYGPLTPPPTYEFMQRQFLRPEHFPESYPQARLHNQWPSSGEIGADPVFDQFMGGQGPSLGDLALTHRQMQQAGAALLDRLGPSVLLTHSAGGAFGWVVADARPKLVKAIVAVEPIGPTFVERPIGRLAWGIAAIPLQYDPPLADPADLKPVRRKAPHPDLIDCLVQSEPARRLPNLTGFPMAVVTAEASWVAQQDHGTVDYLRQAGASVEHLRLEEHGIHGNGHAMMNEKNSDEIAAFIANWIERKLA